jgi:hypothetical protein
MERSHRKWSKPVERMLREQRETWEASMACMVSPVSEQSTLASWTRSLMASMIFFRRFPSVSRASNLVVCGGG